MNISSERVSERGIGHHLRLENLMRKEQEEHENQHRQFLIGLLDCTIKCALISLGFDLSFEVSYPYIICHSSNKMVMICILFVKLIIKIL